MSVVVRMDIDEMPTACGPCKLSCTAICNEWTKVDRKEIGHTKSPNCPIIAILPEGHGRLVDADKLADEMKARKAFFGRMSDPQCLVEDARTIVPAERSET